MFLPRRFWIQSASLMPLLLEEGGSVLRVGRQDGRLDPFLGGLLHLPVERGDDRVAARVDLVAVRRGPAGRASVPSSLRTCQTKCGARQLACDLRREDDRFLLGGVDLGVGDRAVLAGLRSGRGSGASPRAPGCGAGRCGCRCGTTRIVFPFASVCWSALRTRS